MNERDKELLKQADKFANENRTQNIAAPGNNYFELLHEKFADLIRADEREACANVCEKQEDYGPLCETPYECAAGIRARGNT